VTATTVATPVQQQLATESATIVRRIVVSDGLARKTLHE